MKKLENKVAIVTGGARDLGRAVSVKMAEAEQVMTKVQHLQLIMH